MATGLFAKASRKIQDRFALRLRAQKCADTLPALLLAAGKACLSLQSAERPIKRAGSGTEFWQFRNYASHDRPQEIDWRRSAKGDEAIVRMREKQAAHRFVLWCARGQSMQFRSDERLYTKQDYARVLTLALAMTATRSGDHAGLWHIPATGRSSAAIDQIAQGLLEAPLPLHDDLPAAGPASPATGASLFLIGDFLSAPAQAREALIPLGKSCKDLTLIQVLDPAEIALPYKGRITFADMMGTPHLEAGSDSSLQAAYAQRIQSQIDETRALCREQGWRYFLQRTDDEDIGRALLPLLTHNNSQAGLSA